MNTLRTRVARLALAAFTSVGLVVASATAALADGRSGWGW